MELRDNRYRKWDRGAYGSRYTQKINHCGNEHRLKNIKTK